MIDCTNKKISCYYEYIIITGGIHMTVGDYVEYWYNTYRITRHAPSTAALIRNYIHVHIQPSVLGQMELAEARTVHYQVFLRDLILHGNKCKLPSLNTYGQPLSHWTVAKIRQILIAACRWAVHEGLVSKNYAEETESIPITKTHTSVFSIDNQRIFLQHTRHHRFYVAYVLFFYTGCRRGEILGLSWNNVHRRENYIVIDQILVMEDGVPTLKKRHAKTERSLRSIPIPTDIRMLFQEVEQQQKKERKNIPGWKNPENLVFTNADGSPVNPMYFSRNFKNVCKRLGFPADIHLHCTRHTWATNMIQCGAPISDVQALGGWTTPEMLLRIYAHTVKDSHRKAISKLYKAIYSIE